MMQDVLGGSSLTVQIKVNATVGQPNATECGWEGKSGAPGLGQSVCSLSLGAAALAFTKKLSEARGNGIVAAGEAAPPS